MTKQVFFPVFADLLTAPVEPVRPVSREDIIEYARRLREDRVARLTFV